MALSEREYSASKSGSGPIARARTTSTIRLHDTAAVVVAERHVLREHPQASEIMSDVHTAEQRRRNMQAIRSINTKPELLVRRIVHGLGYRFRLYRRDLPGKPHIVLARRRRLILVHGCFWHQHSGCRDCRRPATHAAFGAAKLEGNAARDKRIRRALLSLGWKVLIVWECQTKDASRLVERIADFLSEK